MKVQRWVAVLLAIAIVYAIAQMFYSLNDREGPGEAAGGGAAATGEPAASAKPVQAEAATAVYKSNCLSCHGDQLQGGVGPKLANVGSAMTLDQIRNQIANGGGGMPKFAGTLTDDEIDNVAGWLAAKK